MKEEIRIYNRAELDELVNKEHTCIILKECKRKVELQAKYLKDVKRGIREALDKGLNKFDYSLNGILLDYRRVKVLTDEWNGRIIGKFGEFLVTVQAHFYVFDPKIGSIVEGTVHTKSDAHIGILVHKIFNAMILKSNMDENWSFDDIMIDDKITFSIIDHVFSGHVPFIEGILTAECSKKSSRKKKKKSKVSYSHIQELKENGDVINEKEIFTKGQKKSNTVYKLESSNVNCVQEEGMEDISDMSQKSTCKKKIGESNESLVDNVMEVDVPIVEFKKKKKHKEKEKEKKKHGDIPKTEQTGLSNTSSILEESPVFIDGAISTMTKDDKSLKMKKKKDRKKNEEYSDETKEKKKKNSDNCELTVQKTKECNLHEEDLELVESSQKEKDLENIEKQILKSKKKKRKHDKENSTKLKDISHSDNKLNSADSGAEICDPVQFIDELMNIVPADLISHGETSPVKGSNLENLTSPKRSISVSVNKKIEEEKPSPNRKKRDESFAKNAVENSMADSLEASPSKKRRLEKSLLSSKSNNELEESLFSDSGVTSPMLYSKSFECICGSSKRNPDDIKGKAEEKKDSTFIQSDNTTKKVKKMKKAKDKSTEKKLNEQCPAKEAEFADNIIIAPIDKDKNESQEKKSVLENKSITQDSADAPFSVGQRSSLLDRFKKCLSEDVDGSTDEPSEKHVKTESPVKKMESSAEETKRVKKTVPKQTHSKLNIILEQNTKSATLQPKTCELGAVDSMFSLNPVTTSTPKPVNSEKIIEKSKKKVKKDKGNGDKEREAMIKAIMLQTIKSIGLDDSVSPVKGNSQNSLVQSSIIKWIDTKKSKKSQKKKDEQNDGQH